MNKERPFPARKKRRRKLAHENKALLLGLLAGSSGVAISLILIFTGDYSPQTKWTLALLIFSTWLGAAFAARGAVLRPLQTLSNVIEAMREGDFSIRARIARTDDALGEVMREINALSKLLQEQRLGALESSALLGRILHEIDVAIFTFDARERLQLVNRAGERLLAQSAERLLARTASELALDECLRGAAARTVEMSFAGAAGRWGLRRSTFRQGGVPHQLLVLSDLSRALREEERHAWRRLVRVLGHELNNSLAPVQSITQSLELMLLRKPLPPDWEDDLRRGLRIIAERSEALSRFMRDYARLTRLPEPRLEKVDLGALVRRAVGLETRLPVTVEAGAPVTLQADPDQLEQLVINLIRNAVDASLETGGAVSAGWKNEGRGVELWVRDEGPGISNPANLFVPFFTTKPGGSGIGLALSRQIAEAHGGTLTVENRAAGNGCEARLRLPLHPRVPTGISSQA